MTTSFTTRQFLNARARLDDATRASTTREALLNMATTTHARTYRLADLIAAELAEAEACEDVITYAPDEQLDAYNLDLDRVQRLYRRHVTELPGWAALTGRS